ncbi:MAG: CoA-binding protein [Proteobacteria bacterium]|jgi:predicted CoA-binding protein|nr:CoA-binding protein [Desulfocapsa sp.]MBU3945502.1 CoA-binding protein [Pseudomonadota bacterium]MCG2745108.1 CoA-binding protein [Desulfobacteraceae bacterium]MBU4029213.1 CoA-binding protein [Pseudomonadota bacterium]MBU4043942.1 CoA-binding protein [Pseudomonadota bacterium]
MFTLPALTVVKDVLRTAKTIAVVGFSPKENRPSNMVGCYLIQAGFRVIPVNPGHSEICGLKCYPDLSSIPEAVDVVDIFRRAQDVLPVVEEAISIGAKVIWMQQGIINREAADLAEKAGLIVVMDRCIKVDHMQFGSV